MSSDLVMREHPKNILVVDDNADIREYVALMLRTVGYDVVEAENGRQALAHLEGTKRLPCLLILDLMMPVMSGPELLQELNHHKRLADLPVIVLTAADDPLQVQGACKFLRKSADPRLVLDAVQDVCGAP